MQNDTRLKKGFWGASACALLFALNPAAIAQESDETGEGEFLGTLTLGESKREVQTDTPVAITVIDKEEIDDRQASTIAELIDSVPGVTLVNGSTPSGSGINIRGFGANATFGTDQKVAIVIDGAQTGAEELYRIGTQLFTDPFLFRSVAVQRGTVGSFEYGTGIVGGIVLLETVDPSDITGGEPGFGGALTLGGATNKDAFNGSGTLAFQASENFEVLANFSYREQDDQVDGAGDTIGNSALELPSYLLKARYTAGDHSLTASYTQTDTAERDVPYDTFFTTTDAFGNVDRDITSQTGSLIYAFSPGTDLIDLEVALTYANQEIDSSYVPGSSALESNPFFGPVVIALGDADHGFETIRGTIKNSSFIETGSVTHDLRYGVDVFQRDRVDEEAAPGGTDTRWAVFIVDDIGLTPNLFFTPALRYESSEIEGSIPDPNAPPPNPFAPPMPTPEIDVSVDNAALVGGASLRYEFDNGFSVFGSYAYTESLPIIDDLENAVFIEQPEIANTWEAGFSYDTVGLLRDDDIFAVKLNYFNTVLDDITSYSGADEVSLDGVEIEGSYAARAGFYIDFNANIVNGEETQTSGTVIDWDRAPQDSVRFTVGQRIGQTMDLSAEVLSVFDRDYTLSFTDGVANITDADGFSIVNLRATITPQEGFLKNTQIRVGVENAFDKEYRPFLATRNQPGQNIKLTLTQLF